MELLACFAKLFLFSSGTRSLRQDPADDWIRNRRAHYEWMAEQCLTGDALKGQMYHERDTFLVARNPNKTPLFDKHCEWSEAQWKTYRSLAHVPQR